jgi:hypothetical protein
LLEKPDRHQHLQLCAFFKVSKQLSYRLHRFLISLMSVSILWVLHLDFQDSVGLGLLHHWHLSPPCYTCA